MSPFDACDRLGIIITVIALSTGVVIAADYPWTVLLTVSNEPGSDFEGPVEVVVAFDNDTWHSTRLPYNRYGSGRDYSFPISLVSPGHVQAVTLITHGPCPRGLLPVDTLRLQKVTLVSQEQNVTYTKNLNDLVVKDACQAANDSNGTEIRDFDGTVKVADLDTTNECVLDGIVYANGQRFEMSCRMHCTCDKGTIACVDTCPKTTWAPEQKCRLVAIPGQCCDEVRCEEDRRMHSCQLPKAAGTLKGELHNGERATMGGVQRYPWALLICTDNTCKTAYGGAIVSNRHILTFAPDLRDSKDLLVASGKHAVGPSSSEPEVDMTRLMVKDVLLHPEFVNLGANGSDISSIISRLQLIEIRKPFAFDKELKTANLPLGTSHCSVLASGDCPVMTVGWDDADAETEDSVRHMRLHAQVSKVDPHLCDNGLFFSKSGRIVTFAKSRGGKRSCVSGLIRQDCAGPTGGVVVATASDNTDFLIGLLEQAWIPRECTKPGSARVLPLCKYVDWIAASVS